MCVLATSVICVICILIGVVLPKKLSHVYMLLLFGLALGLYIQGNFVNTDYGVLDGSAINWGRYTKTAIVNTALWGACLFVPLFISAIWPKAVKRGIFFLSLGLVASQLLSLCILGMTSNIGRNTEQDRYLSTEGLHETGKENVIIFVLDHFDDRYFETILEREPSFVDPLTGFTYFDNCTGMYPKTKGAMPYLLTGAVYKNEKPYEDYVRDAFSSTKYYQILKENGYDIGLYTQEQFVYEDIEDLLETMNQQRAGSSPTLAWRHHCISSRHSDIFLTSLSDLSGSTVENLMNGKHQAKNLPMNPLSLITYLIIKP